MMIDAEIDDNNNEDDDDIKDLINWNDIAYLWPNLPLGKMIFSFNFDFRQQQQQQKNDLRFHDTHIDIKIIDKMNHICFFS